MRSQHEPCLQVLTKVLLACLWVWRATAASPEVETGRPPGQPLYNLEFEVEGVVFHNKSLGLDRSFDVLGHQCSPGRPAQPDARLTYTPNRRWPSDARHGRTALVVLIGGPLQRFADRMKSAWDDWRDSFLARLAHSTSVIVLLDADHTNGTDELAALLKLERVDCEQHARACDVAGQVDAGYALFTVLPAEPMQQRPIVLLVGRTAFPAPWWIARNGSTEADLIAADWHTPHCHSPYLRTKFINWHAHRMFRQLRVLDYFDFWVKVDDDARWAGKFPGDITHHLVSKRRIFFHMGLREMEEAELDCIGLWRRGASKPATFYLDTESNRCGRVLWPLARHKPWFTTDTQVFGSEFVGGWLGFWTAPEVLSYGVIWNSFPGGIWEYRWGDAQFFKSAVGLFDDGSHLEDVSYIRPGPNPHAVGSDSRTHQYIDVLHHD